MLWLLFPYIFSVTFPNHISFSFTLSTVLSHTRHNWVPSNTLCFPSKVFMSAFFSLYNSPQPCLILALFILLLKLSFPCLLFYWFIWSYFVHEGKDFFYTLKDQARHKSHGQFLLPFHSLGFQTACRLLNSKFPSQ